MSESLLSEIEALETSWTDKVRAVNALMFSIAQQALVIDLETLDRIIEETARFDTTMPIFAPTRWMHQHDNIHRAERFTRAFRDFRRALEQFRPVPE